MQAARPTRGLKQVIASHPIAAFLVILYLVSWMLFLPAILGKSGLGILSVDIPAQVGILLVTIFGLTGVAFLVTRIADGKAGTRELRSHYFRFRTGPQWYLLAVAGAPVMLLVAGLLTRGGSALTPIMRNPLQIVTVYLLNLIVRDPDLPHGGGCLDGFRNRPAAAAVGSLLGEPRGGPALWLRALSAVLPRQRTD